MTNLEILLEAVALARHTGRDFSVIVNDLISVRKADRYHSGEPLRPGVLSDQERDSKVSSLEFVEGILNPPEPNEKLLSAAEKFKQQMGGQLHRRDRGHQPLQYREDRKPTITNPKVDIDPKTREDCKPRFPFPGGFNGPASGLQEPLTGKGRRVGERKAELTKSHLETGKMDLWFGIAGSLLEKQIKRIEKLGSRRPPSEKTDRLLVVLGRGLRIRETQRLFDAVLGEGRVHVVTHGQSLIGHRFSGVVVCPWGLEDSKHASPAMRESNARWLNDLLVRLSAEAFADKSGRVIYV